ncbi:MAG: hypothetical protein WCK70_16385 [Chloroflexales bacterium]|jgi:hypothetical protein
MLYFWATHNLLWLPIFSEYYLNTILSRREDWQHLAAQSAQVMMSIQAICIAFYMQHSTAK